MALTALVAVTFATPAFAQRTTQKVDRGLRESLKQGGATQKVIISVVPGCRDFVRQSLQKHGDRIKNEHPLIDALSVDLHSDDINELAAHSCIKNLALDAVVSAKAAARTAPTATPAVSNPLRETLGLPAMPTSSTPTGATGVGVAIIDSGIAPSEDFGGRITGFYDFVHGGIPANPYDDYGHGTHIAGLIGSSGKLSGYQYMGIAPDVHFVGLKVLDGSGNGSTSDVIKAIEYVIANKSFLNVQIINLSLGHPIYAPAADDPLVQAVEQASASGLIVVTAAGNYGQNQHGPTGGTNTATTKGPESGYTGITSPGNAPSAITVGAVMTQGTATRGDDVIAPYSSRGPSWFDAFAKPNLVAPGHGLVSDTVATSYLYQKLPTGRVQKNGTAFLSLSGTSMATGVTSGVVALMLQAHNQNGLHNRRPLTPNAVKALLEFSAIPLAGFDYLTQGAGEINAAGAIDLARAVDTDARTGSWWLSLGVSPASKIGGATYAWGQQVIWGGNVMSGSVVYTNNIVWGTNIIWGTNVVWGTAATLKASNIVWGTNIIWGTNIVWSDRVLGQDDDGNIVWGTNVVWGTLKASNVVWGTVQKDHTIIFATSDDDGNIVWGTADDENIVWGTSFDDENVVWGTSRDDENVVWGTALNMPKSVQQR